VFTPTLLSLLIIYQSVQIYLSVIIASILNEQQDINHLIDLCVACVSVDWESLPVVRDPKYMKQSLMVLIQSLNLSIVMIETISIIEIGVQQIFMMKKRKSYQ
jgi:hypothetical protein